MLTSADSPLRKVALAGIIALGLTVVWFLCAATVFGLVQQSLVNGGHYEQLYVRRDGMPVLVRVARTGLTQEVQTLDREVTLGDAYNILYPTFLEPAERPTLSSAHEWKNRLGSISDGGAPPVYWYIVHDGQSNGRAYGVGYHSLTKRVVGYFGRDGFSEVQPPRETWFEVAGNSGLAYAMPERTFFEPYYAYASQSSLFLLASGQLWKIDTQQREVTSLLRCPEANTIGWAWQTMDKLPDKANTGLQQTLGAPRKLVVRTPDACLFPNIESGEVERYELPKDLQRETIAPVQMADGQLVLISYSPLGSAERRLSWIDSAGKVARERSVTLQMPSPEMSEATAASASAVVAPALFWQGATLIFLAQNAIITGKAESIPAALAHSLGLLWPSILIVLAISSAAAWSAFRRQRQFGLPGAMSWAVFVFVFGVAGWLAHRWHRTWPVMEDCPHCRQPAPRDREECTECGADYPLPELKGTEVFA